MFSVGFSTLSAYSAPFCFNFKWYVLKLVKYSVFRICFVCFFGDYEWELIFQFRCDYSVPFGQSKNWKRCLFKIMIMLRSFFSFPWFCDIGTFDIFCSSLSCYRINCRTSDLFVFILSLGANGYESIVCRFRSGLFIPMVRLFTWFAEIYFDDYRLLPNRFQCDGPRICEM